jgi:hypothetical protein
VPAGGNGQDGANGQNMLTLTSPATTCANGGTFLQFGLDANNNDILEAGEINPALNQTICNGLNGAPGSMGPQGPAGSVNGAHNGASMSDLSTDKVAFGQTIGQAGYNMRFINHGNFGIGTITGDSKLTVKNTKDGVLNMPYDQIFRLRNSNDYDVLNVKESGRTSASAIYSGASSHQSYSFMTDINDNNPNPSNITGLSSVFTVNTGVPSAQFLGFYTALFNPLGHSTGSEIIIRTSTAGGTATGVNHGQKITVRDGAQNIGTYYEVHNGLNNKGIISRVSGDGEIYGGQFLTYGDVNTNTIYGIYSAAFPQGTTNAFAGYFRGAVHVDGTLTIPSGTVTASDQMFKTNINDIPNALEKINALQPRTYSYDTINYADFNFESDQQMGLIAQEVEQVLPTLVSSHKRPAEYDSLGNIVKPEITYKGVEYEELIPLLVAGMKEQQTQIASKDSVINNLNERLTQLENCLSALLPTLCSMNQEAIQQNNDAQQKQYEKALEKTGNSPTENTELRAAIEVRLSDKNTIILSQNVPNPFAEMTTIKYSIPTTVKEAQIHFYTTNGIIINSVDIVERGNGEIRVFAEDLSSGLYTYSLVADGKAVATKKMLKN